MYNPFSLENKTIVVTGASSGIGRQCAIDCSRMGAKVALVARNEERLAQTLSMMEGEGHASYSFDLTNIEGIKQLVCDIVEKQGKIDGLLHAAGISSVIPLKLIKPQMYDNFFSTNVYTSIELAKEVSRIGNYNKGTCSIVIFSSIMGVVGEKGKTLYSASKGAIVSSVRSMACELALKGIRINAVSPGAILTPINASQPYMADPEKRKQLESKHLLGLGKPEDISNTCVFLLSEASRWITGQNIIVDGGYTAQ